MPRTCRTPVDAARGTVITMRRREPGRDFWPGLMPVRELFFGGVSAKESSESSRSPPGVGGPSDDVCEVGRVAKVAQPSAIAGGRKE